MQSSCVLNAVGWLACCVYATIPGFWLLIHPRADYWRSRFRSPYRALLPLWIGMWIVAAAVTAPWRKVTAYRSPWAWLPAVALFVCGLTIYRFAAVNFSLAQLGGLPEVLAGNLEQRLVRSGIRKHIRHPIYLAHLCEMLGWSIGTGVAVCSGLTAFAIVTGAIMIRLEDEELSRRFGEEFREYRERVPAVLPKLW
ncbi:MAG: isoprenylcysteine carboxylmethyltransferase family protein [Acidobacteriales bacterium]|nr:isoprenylcysteine carboxylmethyltransferase family protein [Terriglobales bacterium]